MVGKRPTKLVRIVQQALAAGPVSREHLLARLQEAGVRVDVGMLWETCRTHGIADLRGDVWVPRGWAPPAAERHDVISVSANLPNPAVPVQRSQPESTRRDRLAQRAEAQVRHLAESVGLGEPEAVPPVGPVPAGWNEAARGARRALADELAAVTSRRTETDVPLLDGRETGQTATRRLVRYEAQSEIGSAEGARALLIVQELQIEVEVISVFGAVVTLSLPADSPVVSEATLRLDMSWLLSAQSRRLWELKHGGPGFDGVAALEAVEGEATPAQRAPSAAIGPLLPDEAAGLNDGQRQAVELALTPGVTWIWGPPGTGKTTTISALVAALASRGKRVLLAAPTNAALDVAVTSLLERAAQLAANGVVVRLGQPTDKLLNHDAGSTVLVDAVAAQRGAPLAAKRVDVGQRLQQARRELAELRRGTGRLDEE